jgi:acyl-CoA reductase-like NAD-dependent aldehyde dehydrogenase
MAATATETYKQLIGGEWVGAADGATYDDNDPYTGEIVAIAPAASATDATTAVEAAASAFAAWSQTPPVERQRIFLKAADLLEARRDEVVGLLARETGASFGFGMFQSFFVPNLFRQAAALAYAPIGQVIPSDSGAFAMGLRKPAGVVGAFAPWNAALILSARSIAAPLALGNTVVLKPSEWSPFTGGLLWGEIFEEAGLPAGVLNIVTHAPGAAQGVGNVLIEHPAVRRLNFTGSSQVGRLIAEVAGRQLKRVVLELGGHNPLIVLDDADLDYAVNASAFGSYLHQGQICMSTRRIYVERGIGDEFVARLAEKTKGLKAGDPKEHDTVIGPLINEQALEMVKSRVAQAVADGATILAGGEAVGPCFQATLLTGVPESSEFAKHETFGPVAAVEIVDDADAAVAKANRTSYGLSAGIITSNGERGFALAQQIDSGIVHINDQTVADEPQMPFGGVKDSGFGRFGGLAVVDEFTELRWITVRPSTGHPFPF